MRAVRGPRRLSTRLVVTAVALVTIVAALIAVVTTVAMQTYLTGQLDAEVRASLERVERVPRDFLEYGLPPLDDDPGPMEPPEVRGQPIGAVTAFLFRDHAGLGDVVEDRGSDGAERVQLDATVVDILTEVPRDGEVHAVDLPGLGSYRVAASDSDGEGSGSAVATGLPDAEVGAAVGSLLRIELGLLLLGTLVAWLAGRVVVRRQLRPLTEVAQTAHAVAELPLASGAIGVTERVPAHLTDERTEVGQVGAALNTLLAHVEGSLDARHRSEQQVRQFVADASHELRTPLATIVGYTELARRRPGDPGAAATALGKVEEESARMTSLVEDLLLLARLDAGRPLAREPVDLTRLLLEAVSDARVLGPDHRWRLELPDEAVGVTGDEQRLHQVVTNLLTNARKHTPPGTTVTVTARSTGFAVHDDGPGFPADLVSADGRGAFERFARGDAARTRGPSGGAGLGLAIVQAVVSAHGGRVELRTRPGDTTIEVELPAR